MWWFPTEADRTQVLFGDTLGHEPKTSGTIITVLRVFVFGPVEAWQAGGLAVRRVQRSAMTKYAGELVCPWATPLTVGGIVRHGLQYRAEGSIARV